MNKRCLIISGGEFCPIDPPAPGVFVIACDRGYDYALRCGVRPDLVVSDFDSGESAVPRDVPLLRFPTVKDDTDTMIAVRWACENGFREAELVCALGGRLDHLLANIQTAVFALEHGLRLSITGPDTLILALRDGGMTLPKREGWSLSVFAVSDECRGVRIRGTKYELEDAVLTNGFPLGVSNEWRADEASVSVAQGILLIVSSKL